MAKNGASVQIKSYIALAGILTALAWSPSVMAQQFDVPEGFVISPEADTATSNDWKPLTAVRPVEGPFSELSTISLRVVRSEVTDPDAWLAARLTAQIGDPASIEEVFSSPDSPFSDPVFDTLKKIAARVVCRLAKSGANSAPFLRRTNNRLQRQWRISRTVLQLQFRPSAPIRGFAPPEFRHRLVFHGDKNHERAAPAPSNRNSQFVYCYKLTPHLREYRFRRFSWRNNAGASLSAARVSSASHLHAPGAL